MAAQQIGIVTTVVGHVVAVNADGVERVLAVGDVVYADEVIRTADAAAVTIEFNDGGWFDLGGNAQAVLDSDVYSQEGPDAEAAGAVAKVEDIQAAIEAGADPTQLLPPTAAGAAAGGAAGGEGGHSFVALDHDFNSVNPEAGIPTAAEPLVFQNVIDIILPVEEEDQGVQILDLAPAVQGGDATVFERFLTGGGEGGGPVTGTGTFTVVAPDGIGSVDINGVTVIDVDGLTGNPVTSPLGNQLVLTGYNPATGVVTYEYTLLDSETHPAGGGENALFDDLPVVLTDSDGDTTTDTLSVQIVDDVPIARNDTDSIAAGSLGPATGNVITDAEADGGADTVGADGARVSGVASNNVSGNSDTVADTSGNFSVVGQYGTLTLNQDGSYSYTRNPGTSGGVSDVFTYTLTDGDGDTDTATLTISLGDGTPTLDVPTAGEAGTSVNEAGLGPRGAEPAGSGEMADGNPTNNSNTSETTAGVITYSAGDAPATVSIGGTAVTAVGQTIAGAYGTLTITSLSGTAIGYSYTLTDNTSGDATHDDFSVVVTDTDGDATPAQVLSIAIVDDAPSTGTNALVQLDDDALTGNAGGVGDDADSVNTTGTLAHVFGADGGSIAFVASGAPTGFTYETSGNNLLIKQGATTVLTVTLNPATGGYTVTQSAPILHASADNENNQVFTLAYRVTDGDGDTADGSLNINVDDDTPTNFTAQSGTVADKDIAPTVFALNFAGSIGADQPGTVVFDVANNGMEAKDTAGNLLKLDGQQIYLFGDGTGTLTGTTSQTNDASGTVAFTITLNPGADTYTVDLNGTISNGQEVSFTDLTSATAGNVVFRGIGHDDPASAVDVLLSGRGGTVNSDALSIGVGDNHVQTGEAVRVDFVTDLTTGAATPTGFAYASHTLLTGFEQKIWAVQGGPGNTVTVVVTALRADNDQDFDNNPGDGIEAGEAKVDITAVRVYDAGGVEVTSLFTDGNAANGEITITGGVASVAGLQQGYTYAITTATPFSAVVVENGGGSGDKFFDLGVFSIQTVNDQTPIALAYDLVSTDADGDPAAGRLALTLQPSNEAPTAGTSSATVSEEGLSGGLVDALPAGTDTTDSPTVSGTVPVGDADGDALNVTLDAPTTALASGGVALTWEGVGTQTLTGKAGGVSVVTITIDNGGHYTVTLAKPLDHPGLNVEDVLNFSVPVTVSDGAASTLGAINVTVEDDAPQAHAVVAHGQGSVATSTNLMLILDVSGSMDDSSRVQGMTRLELMQSATLELLEQYDALGDVKIKLVTFESTAQEAGDTSQWMTVAQARDVIIGLSADGGTNYDDALKEAMSVYTDGGKIDGANNVAYFVSDGQPTISNSHPNQNGSVMNPEYGDGIGEEGINASDNEVSRQEWEAFLNDHDITAYAIGMGTGVSSDNLAPVAYDGAAGAQIDPIVVTDLNDLIPTLVATVAASPISGNVASDAGNGFGADGGHLKSITVDGVTYAYNPAGGGSISVSGGPDHGTFNTASNELTVTINAGGSIRMNMDTGAYTYVPPGSLSGRVSATVGFTLVDGDGDTASSTLTVTVDPATGPLVIRDDIVISNMSSGGIVIPQWALLANDTNPATAAALALAAVSAAVSGTVSAADGNVTFVDTGTSDGSFVYTASNGATSDTATVTVDRTTNGTLTGSHLGEVLVDNDNRHTLNGNAGNDVLIGNGGNDTLNGGEGNDILAGGAGNDVLNGGAGIDTATYIDAAGGVTASLASGDATGEGSDTFNSIENLTGSAFNDSLTGNSSANTLMGLAGNDILVGNDGNDLLIGGPGDDTMTGGAGADTFKWGQGDLAGSTTGDVITDFSVAQGDKLDIADLLTGYAAGSDPNNFVQLDTSSGNSTVVKVDVDGGGDHFQTLATLSGVVAPPVANMIASGNLVLTHETSTG